MTTTAKPDCYDCRHQIDLTERTCTAFPNGIPKSIFWEGKPHDKKHPAQTGALVFEMIPEGFDPKENAVTYCKDCRWYTGKLMCEAYNAIPPEIYTGARPHTLPLANQKGLFVFEKK